MKIGIDIDNTMYHLDVVEQVSTLLNLDFKTEDVKHWLYDKQRVNGFPKYFTDLIYAHFDDPNYLGKLKLYDGVYEKLKQWKNNNHQLYIITARRPSVYIETVKMLNRDFGLGFFDGIHFVEHKTDAKEDMFKTLKLDVWIDDNPKDIENACYLGLNVYCINNQYTKYNDKTVLYCTNNYDKFSVVRCIGDIYL